ncbi:hypothetical protein QBC34DRAFT_477527 [Podospora aff. communis PSN243]|uniref:SnoaL-like domain-containing protein n=1 Tax=Podospora aff. communis PSN243 TaxID=3040156 RepID=A0AAV9G7U8_9PEZI|nr:hypothetical protein QBC34DRAFT_477527 [Podospora aff. communis PSN243]
MSITSEALSIDSEAITITSATGSDTPGEAAPATTAAEEPSSVRLATVRTLLKGYSSLSVSQLLHPLSKTFTHQVLPVSLGMPVRNRDSFALHAKGIFAVFDTFRLVPESMYEDRERNVVVIHARMEGILANLRGWWGSECVMFVRLSEDGKKVEGIWEFVDSWKAVEMRNKFAPREFGLGPDGMSFGMFIGMGVGGVLLFVGLATGTLFGVRRMLRG